MGVKANHHYVPQFYLRGFAHGVKRKAKVWVFDKEKNASFPSLVRNVGSKRYFNRIDVDGIDPNALEDAMAELEGEFATHLSEVIEAKGFPSEEHFNSIMNLLANLSVRNPRMRTLLAKFHKDIAKTTTGVLLSSKEIWESQSRKMEEAGYHVNPDLTYEDLKEFHQGQDYDIQVDQTHLIKNEFDMLDPVLQCSARRNWSFVTPVSGSQFITSDDPIVLAWIDAEKNGRFPPGHGLPKTVVFFPLCTGLLLVGTFEELPKEMSYSADEVEQVNSQITGFATRQIYAKDGSFTLSYRGETGITGELLPEAIKRLG